MVVDRRKDKIKTACAGWMIRLHSPLARRDERARRLIGAIGRAPIDRSLAATNDRGWRENHRRPYFYAGNSMARE